MEQSFWKNNKCVPTWSQAIQASWKSYPATLAEPGQYRSPIYPISGYEIKLSKQEDLQAVIQFWNRFYSTSSKSRCCIPLVYLQACVKAGIWDIFICISLQTGEIMGTGVRRWIQNLHIGETVWKTAAMIDYFCVHPSMRKKGIGRWILSTLHNTGPVPLPPHLIHWEGIQVGVPPTSSGVYWMKQRETPNPTQKRLCKRITITQLPTVEPPWIWSEPSSLTLETHAWQTEKGIVTIWNTFHKRVPDGAWIGVILYGSQEAADEMIEVGPYGVLLSPKQLSGWSFDSPWQWFIYNCVTGMGVQYPFLCL